MAHENFFERIVAVDNLRTAWIKAKHYARTEEVCFDAYAYGAVEEHLEANLAVLRHELASGEYRPAPLRYVAIPKGDRVRKLYFAAPRDCVVIQAVINVIGPIFEAQFSDLSFGNRLNVGDSESHDIYHRWQDQYTRYNSVVRGFLNAGPDAWYLITDIEDFYPSIRIERLYGLIAAEVHDERTLAIIDMFLNLQAINLDEQEESLGGLPPGPLYAHFFANIYLTGLDHLAIQHTLGYARYVDDICLICQDENSLLAVERSLKDYLGQWNQDFNASKTERHSVKEWRPLIEHTRRMRYAGRLDFVEALDLGPQQIAAASDAEELFQDLYLVVEKEGDIDRLVEEAGFVISQLRELGAPNLDDIVYSLLETHPLKPSTLRVALSCLLESELPNPSQRFRQSVLAKEDDQGYIRINLLQILPHFVPVSAQVDLAELRQILTAHFDDSELRDLCFDLGVDYESLSGQGKSDKARELVAYFERRGHTLELVKTCRQLRPNASWDGVLKTTKGVPLQSIPREVLGDASELRTLLVEAFLQDPNYLVRANTYVALKILAEHGAMLLSIDELRRFREIESSPYAVQRLIDCYAVVPGEAVWLPLTSLVTPDSPEQVVAVARVFCQLLESGRLGPMMLESILPAFERLDPLDSTSYVHLFYLTARFGAFWMIPRILEKARQQIGELADELFSIVTLEVIGKLASQTQLGRLYQFADVVGQVGLRNKARLGFEEVISRTQDDDLRQRAQVHRDALRQAAVSVGLPDWVANDPTCNRGLYRETKGDSEYLCFKFFSEARQCAGTLELISARRIQESGFSDVEDWIAYLQRLDEDGLISLIEAGPYQEDRLKGVFCLYEIPQGFQAVAEWLQHSNVSGLLPVPIVLELGLSLVQALSKTQRSSFHLRSIDPLNVLWNPTGEIKLLNVGASLGIASYQCGIPRCPAPSDRDEIGPTTTTYHLGLLLLQLLRRRCPLEAVNLTRSRYGKHPTLQELIDEPETPPHFRLVLARMLQKVPDYRYESLEWLEEDLRDCAEFTRSLSVLHPEDKKDTATWYTLQDFVAFHLKIISRNPEYQAYPPAVRTYKMLEALSGSLAFLPNSMLSTWKVHIRRRSQLSIFPSGFQARRLSPEGRRLLGIAEGWEEAVTQPGTDRYIPTPLTKLCLYHALAVETSACLIASLMSSSDISQDTVAEMTRTVLNVMGELRDAPSAVFTIRPLQQTSISISARFFRDDLQQLQRFIGWLRGDHVSRFEKRAISLKAVGLFWVLFAFDCELVRNNRVVAQSQPVLRLNRTDLRGSNLWQLLKDLAALDEEVSHFGEGFYIQQASEAWTRLSETIAFIRSLSPGRRWAAELYSYQYWEGTGIIQLTFPRFGELSFSRSEVFVSGGLIKKHNARRPVRVDVWDEAGERKICSVLAPSEHFGELPLPSRRYSPPRIATWMRKHPYQRACMLTTIGLALPAIFVWFIGSVLGITVPLLFHSIASLLGAIVSNLWADSLQRILATAYPENARLVE